MYFKHEKYFEKTESKQTCFSKWQTSTNNCGCVHFIFLNTLSLRRGFVIACNFFHWFYFWWHAFLFCLWVSLNVPEIVRWTNNVYLYFDFIIIQFVFIYYIITFFFLFCQKQIHFGSHLLQHLLTPVLSLHIPHYNNSTVSNVLVVEIFHLMVP